MLAEITGFAAVSLQPNAGSQGEYAGLLVIRKCAREPRTREPRRCASSLPRPHGTNPPARCMAGIRGGGGDERRRDGSIDLADLEAKATPAPARLAR